MIGSIERVGGDRAAFVKPDHQVFCARRAKGLILIPSIGPRALTVFDVDSPGRTEHRAYFSLRGLFSLLFSAGVREQTSLSYLTS